MRTGACTIHQTLTAEAASVLKHSLILARRRGHAQVTPLHVAATLLASRSSLLRRACLKSQPLNLQNQSHPLHCRALELCFNVALNRLPTSPNPLVHGQPSLSNALVAALKRAQAHQRRGCIEQQSQQPLLTIKVELEQLVISILDDPSVSRVMREAGFSSTAVKNKIEDCSVSPVFYGSSVGVFSSPCSPSSSETLTQREREHHQNVMNPISFWQTHLLNQSAEPNPFLISHQRRAFSTDPSISLKEDVKLVVEVFLNKKKRNAVIVGDTVSLTEGLVGELLAKIERGDVPEELQQTHLLKFQFSPVALKIMKKDDVEANMSELKRKVDSLTSCGKGAIVYAGNLKWTLCEQETVGSSCYDAADHLVSEIGRLFSDCNTKNNNTSSNTRKVWLLATASYQTYIKCKTRQPPLDVQWAFQAVSVPSGGLGLSLHGSSLHDSRVAFNSQVVETKPFAGKEEEHTKLTCCAECASNYEKEAQAFKSCQQKLLPSWLQPHGDHAKPKDELVGLRRKWNRFCESLHQGRNSPSQFGPALLIGKGYSYGSPNAWWHSQSSVFSDSASISFADSPLKPSHRSTHSVAKFRRQNSCTIEFNFGDENQKERPGDPEIESDNKSEGRDVKITLALGHSPALPISGISDEEKNERTICKNNLLKKLHDNVPWHSEILASIADQAVSDSTPKKNDAWILLHGNDTTGKRRVAHTIAESVYGSAAPLLQINVKKQRGETNTCCQMIKNGLRDQGKLVVFVEGIDSADTQFVKFLSDGFQSRKFGDFNRKGCNDQVIFILTKDDDSLANNQDSVIRMILKVDETSRDIAITPSGGYKRKSELSLTNKLKNARIEDAENESSVACATRNVKKDFSRQSSFNSALDLNLKANEDEEDEVKPGVISPNSSDLTREMGFHPGSSKGFLGSIRNQFVLDLDPARGRETRDSLMDKIQGSFQEILGKQNMGLIRFSVEERVVKELCFGSGYFDKVLFGKWLRDIFEMSLANVIKSGKWDMGVIKLCFGGIDDKVVYEEGFMGTCLPKTIQVSFMD